MHKHKRTIAIISLLAIAAVWIIVSAWKGGDDETTYRQYIREVRLARVLFPALNRRPAFVAWPVEYARRRLFGRIRSNEDLLLASGYLTNVSIVLTNASQSLLSGSNSTPTVGAISLKLHSATPEYRFLPFALRTDESKCVSVELLCRTKDVAFYRQVLANE
jgi:hypothetical protein